MAKQPIVLELRAIGPKPDQQWRFCAAEDSVVRLGRCPQQGWAVPWDARISREHADLMFEGNRLFVRCLAEARNSAYHQDQPTRKFTVEPGEEFRIGSTIFRLQRVSVASVPVPDSGDDSQEAAPSSTESQLKRLQARLAAEDSRFQPATNLEQNLQAVLDLLDLADDGSAEPPSERPKSLRDTQAGSRPDIGTATPSTLRQQIEQVDRPLQPHADWRRAAQNVDGTALHDYFLLDQVGSGETGQVFLAEHKTLGRRVALNILSETAALQPDLLERFRCKSQFLASCSHPNLVRVFDAGQQAGVHYLVMEYLDGASLAELLRESGPLNVELAVQILLQAAQALEFLHERGVLHGNPTPANLLVDRQAVVKLIGLGQAWYSPGCELPRHGGLSKQSAANSDGGSHDVLPEPGQVDCRADIHALGCTLFTALTAQFAFPVSPPCLSGFRDDIPPGLDEIFQKMVHPDPACGYASLREVLSALERLP